MKRIQWRERDSAALVDRPTKREKETVTRIYIWQIFERFLLGNVLQKWKKRRKTIHSFIHLNATSHEETAP